MKVLRTIESKIEGLFEGVFGRAFRTHVQPIELARKLVKEMDEHRTVSVSRVYAPNEYTVYLSPQDRRQFGGYEASLVAELEEYLAEHARRERYSLPSPPHVRVTTDDDLAVGEFGIATRLAEEAGDGDGALSARGEEPAPTMVYRAAAPSAPEPKLEPQHPPAPAATLELGGRSHPVQGERVVLGRSREADVRVSDVNVSRRHAEIRREDGSYWLVDLGSTNGTLLNGRRVARERLDDGDVITLGSTEIVFGLPRS
ncbi:MAG TPA: DUF3662 and FHA domain-containing protein [Gaiellaceae bacterium]|nr:DUF3662 and FHA domain-containing protein [Gaiellaceae bacterium]